MPIVESDLLFRFSIKTGSAGNTLSQDDPNQSLGKYIATNVYTNDSLHNLFDVVSAAEEEGGSIDYRCIFALNNHATLTWKGARFWIESQAEGGATITVGKDPAGATPKGQAAAQAAEIATEGDTPAGVSFSSPSGYADGISLGDIAAGYCHAIWIKRTVGAGCGAKAADNVWLRAKGETEA